MPSPTLLALVLREVKEWEAEEWVSFERDLQTENRAPLMRLRALAPLACPGALLGCSYACCRLCIRNSSSLHWP